MNRFFVLPICISFFSAFAADSRDDGTWEFVTTLKSAADEAVSVRIEQSAGRER
jgi:hypothetical protein